MSRRRSTPVRTAAAAALVLLVTVACSDSEPAASAPPPQASLGGSQAVDDGGWTVLQFAMADNNLEPFMMDDLDELAAVKGGGGLAVTAFVDRAEKHSDAEALGLGDWVGAKTVDIAGGKGTVVREEGDVDTGDPKVLQDFITDGIKRHPNDHYALVISDHGASWPGVGEDESTEGGDGLGLTEIAGAVSGALEASGVEKLDLLGFDACLMAGYEVASEMAPLADRMVASQELEPGHGWDYGAFSTLTDGSSAEELGNAIIKGFTAQAVEQGTSDEITLSMVDLTKMEAVDEAVTGLAEALSAEVAAVAPAVGKGRASNLGFGRSPDPQEDTQMTDLGMLAAGIATGAPSVAEPARAVVAALGDAVVSNVDSSTTKGATGLSIYFPPNGGLAAGAYKNVPSASSWSQFLTDFHGEGNDIPEAEQAAFADEEPTVTFEDGEAVITAAVPDEVAGKLVGATTSYGIVGKDGTVTYFGEESADITDGEASGTYDFSQLVMSDGEDEVTAYAELLVTEGSDLVSIDIPMAYYAPEDVDGETYQDVLLSLTIDTADDEAEIETTYYAYDEDSGTYGELTAEPEGIIVPEVLSYDEDGEPQWTASAETGLYADLETIGYEFKPLAKGTKVQLDLTVEDFGGNLAELGSVVTTP